MSGKYESEIKITKKNPHIWVFSSTGPKTHRMTLDRWNIISDPSDSMTLHDLTPPSQKNILFNIGRGILPTQIDYKLLEDGV